MEARDRPGSTSGRLSKFQQKRRDAALERQRAARKAHTERARQLADRKEEQCGHQVAEMDQDSGGPAVMHQAPPGEKPHVFWAQQLMHPEWMVDVPGNLSSEWYVTPRPEGKRCIVVAAKGVTTSRTRNGMVLHRFQSALPNGSRRSSGPSAPSVLDCIFHEADSTYYVLDMMAWRGHDMYNCTTEFRMFWLDTKLHEDEACGLLEGEETSYRFTPLASAMCCSAALGYARSASVPFIRDGLLFRHKDGHYTPGLSPSPLSLLWKDPSTSRYFIDTDPQGNILPHQAVVLEYRMDHTVATSDDPPIVLGKLPESFVSQMGKKLKVGMPLRFSIRDGGIQFVDGQPVGADLHFEGASNPRRGRVDSSSKILFQYQARREPLTCDILVAATSQEENMATSAD